MANSKSSVEDILRHLNNQPGLEALTKAIDNFVGPNANFVLSILEFQMRAVESPEVDDALMALKAAVDEKDKDKIGAVVLMLGKSAVDKINRWFTEFEAMDVEAAGEADNLAVPKAMAMFVGPGAEVGAMVFEQFFKHVISARTAQSFKTALDERNAGEFYALLNALPIAHVQKFNRIVAGIFESGTVQDEKKPDTT